MSSFTCGFWPLQKCRLLSEDSIINDPAGGKDSGSRTSPEEESHPFCAPPSRARENCDCDNSNTIIQ